MKPSFFRSYFSAFLFAVFFISSNFLAAQTSDPNRTAAPEGEARRKIIQQIQRSQAMSPEILRVTVAKIGNSESEQTIAVEQEDLSFKKITIRTVRYRLELRIEGVIRTKTQLKVGDTIVVEYTNNYPGSELYNIPETIRAAQKHKVFLQKDPDEKSKIYHPSAAFASFIEEKTDQ